MSPVDLYTALYSETDYGIEKMLEPRNSIYVNFIKSLVPTTATILDVSCGRGWLMRKLIKLGYTVEGTELVPALLDRDLKGLKVRICYIENIADVFPPSSFDVVIANDVLEHLSCPLASAAAVEDLAHISRDWLLVSCGMHSSKCMAWKDIQLHPVQKDEGWWRTRVERYIDIEYADTGNGSCFFFGRKHGKHKDGF